MRALWHSAIAFDVWYAVHTLIGALIVQMYGSLYATYVCLFSSILSMSVSSLGSLANMVCVDA